MRDVALSPRRERRVVLVLGLGRDVGVLRRSRWRQTWRMRLLCTSGICCVDMYIVERENGLLCKDTHMDVERRLGQLIKSTNYRLKSLY